VALAVISTAATILVSLFGSSLMLSRTNRSQLVAASLAQEQMESILRNSSNYVWSALDGAQPGQLVEVTLADRGAARKPQPEKSPAGRQEGPAGHVFADLKATPVDPAANTREENFYKKFRWQAYAALPQADSKRVDVTVVVRWTDSGREKSVALTSSAPRFTLGPRPGAAERPLATVQPGAGNAGGNV
jgi:hypothetical protein